VALKPCRECKKEVSTEAKTCPHCGVAKPVPPAPPSTAATLAGVWIVTLLLLGVGYCFYSSANETPRANDPEARSVALVVACEQEALARLKAPSTAQFSKGVHSNQMVQSIGGGQFVVHDYVDAENDFGAKIRTDVTCWVRYDNGVARVDRVVLGPNNDQSERIEPTAPASPAPPQQQAASAVPFKIIGKEEYNLSIVVPQATTDEQLVALVNSFRAARAAGTLATMIPPTTPGGSNGPYGGVQVFIFTDPAWASTARMHSFNFATTSKATGSNKVFLEKIRAYYYYYDVTEVGSIGYGFLNEDMRNSSYRLLFPN